MLSFFTVTSSWQSGEMTLSHRDKRQSKGQMGWCRVCEKETLKRIRWVGSQKYNAISFVQIRRAIWWNKKNNHECLCGRGSDPLAAWALAVCCSESCSTVRVRPRGGSITIVEIRFPPRLHSLYKAHTCLQGGCFCFNTMTHTERCEGKHPAYTCSPVSSDFYLTRKLKSTLL